MTVDTKLTENDDLLVISVNGVFDFSMLDDFRTAYTRDIEESTRVVIDMRNTLSINSSALGMLLNMQRHLCKADGEIEVINCNEVVKKIFNITHFNKKFSIG